MLNIVLFEPEIPQNTGNIARTCAVTGTRLHLIKPLGFDISEKAVRRAGLDYWHMVDLTVYEEGYKWLVSVLFENMEMTDYVPFTLTFAANQVSDAVGNRNSEAVFNVVMKDSQPSLRAAVSGRADADLTLTATFTNGPVSELAREAIDMSDNVELTTMAVKEATETTTVYELHLVSKCTVSCEYWVHFKAESIYDDAGNRLAEDVMVNEAFPMMPVLRYQEDALCGEKSCLVTITSSENIDMDCKDVEVETEGYAFVPNLCLNTKECVCQLTTAQETVALTRVTYKVGAKVAFNSYHVGNAASEPLHLWHATERLVPVIASAWKEGDGIKDIAFSASWGMDMDMTPAMFHCKNCEIHDWEKGEAYAYAFKVSFFDENDRYAVVSVPEGAAVDPFGRATAAGEFVLRREAVAPRVVRFRATGSAKTTVLLEFSKDVKPCGGEIALTSDRMPQYNYRIATSSSAVKTNGRIVELEAALLSDAAYTVSFTSNAFCDESSYPMDVECTMCAFRTAKGVPVAPKTLEVTRVMARSVEVAYAEGYNGGDQVLSMTVSTFPASALPPVVVTYPAMEGSVRVEGLEPNTEYALFVVFTNSFGDSFPSTLTFTTSAGTPKSATDLRVCDVIDPTTVGKNSYVYTRAKACWTPSVTPSVTYVLHVLPLDHEGMEETTIAVETPFAEFAVGNDAVPPDAGDGERAAGGGGRAVRVGLRRVRDGGGPGADLQVPAGRGHQGGGGAPVERAVVHHVHAPDGELLQDRALPGAVRQRVRGRVRRDEQRHRVAALPHGAVHGQRGDGDGPRGRAERLLRPPEQPRDGVLQEASSRAARGRRLQLRELPGGE